MQFRCDILRDIADRGPTRADDFAQGQLGFTRKTAQQGRFARTVLRHKAQSVARAKG